MMRFRDDKPAGNHIKTVECVIESIRDGVEKDVVSTTLRSQGDRHFSKLPLSPSYWKNARSYGLLGKRDTANRPNRQLLISPRDPQTSLPLWPNNNKNHYRRRRRRLLSLLNLRTLLTHNRCEILNRTNASGNHLSRTLRRARKVLRSRRNRRRVLTFRCQTVRLGTDRCKRRSGARSLDQRNGVVCIVDSVRGCAGPVQCA